MFIIIEGTDGAGKSSLIEAIENSIKAQYGDVTINKYHKGKPEQLTRRWVLNDYVNEFQDVDFTESFTIADRWHWGEITYAPTKRPQTNKDGYGLLGKAGWRWVELFLASRGAMQIHLSQPLDVLQKRITARGDDYIDVSELADIKSAYEYAASQTVAITNVSPDPNDISKLPDLANQLVELATERAEHVEDSNLSYLYSDYIGPVKPKILLVGDRHNETKKYGRETNLPFMPVDGNSGEFLLNNLPDDAWKQVGMINANDTQCSIIDLWHVLGKPTIVALGRLAERGLIQKHGFFEHESYTVPHPQFVRRFANKHGAEYGQAIIDLADGKVDEKWILR